MRWERAEEYQLTLKETYFTRAFSAIVSKVSAGRAPLYIERQHKHVLA
jgi:hypothetical protein